MKETLRMMKSIITGKEKETSEKDLILEYKNTLKPNILAYFFDKEFGMCMNVNSTFPQITEEDKASFCLEELDKCLLNFDFTYDVKFTTYFIKCYKLRLRMELEQLLVQKRKIMFMLNSIDEANEIEYEQEFNEFNKYNLNDTELKQFNLLMNGYDMIKIAKILGKSISLIYKQNAHIKQKILEYSIN